MVPALTPETLVAVLLGLVGLVFLASRAPALSNVFAVAPPVLWCYFVPMLLGSAGALPRASPVYDTVAATGLLVALFLLTVTVDVPAILRVGPRALAMLLAGSLGIVIGGPVAFLLFRSFLPPDAWMGLAALSGTWIGGTANMVAIKEGIGAPDSVIAPIIVVDTVFAYGWMGVLLFLSTQQKKVDRWLRADRRALDAFTGTAAEEVAPAPTSTHGLAVVVGAAFAVAGLARWVSGFLPPLGDPVIVSRNTWAILLTVTLGIGLSFTRVRRLDRLGASPVGYFALYLLLATIGAQADLAAIASFPAYMAVGAVWMAIHLVVLFAAARLLRAPLALVATGSMATVGGPASTPVVAGAYAPALAPVGLLLAVGSNLIGLYLSLGCAYVLERLAH